MGVLKNESKEGILVLSSGNARISMKRDTELRLLFWRDGSTQAERLAASALGLLGYEEIDPQSPLGGPDGTKDIVCRKGAYTWIAAVHFPTGPISFTAIKKKYSTDLLGAPSGHQGFCLCD
jgi:hypothetical protein